MRVDAELYRALQALAQQEGRSVSQVARRLVGDGLRQRMAPWPAASDDAPGTDIAVLAAASGAFDWLASELDLYDDTSGEPL